jgi:hypothetical protein
MQLLTLTRLNHDSSWLIGYGDAYLLLDPWLQGEQVDGYRWFSVQIHAQPCIPVGQLPPLTAIAISHPFTDHCHEATLRRLPASTPIMAAPAALGKVEALQHFTWPAAIQNGFNSSKHVAVLPFEVSHWPAPKKLDLTHTALLIKILAAPDDAPGILYAPHGLWPEQAKAIRARMRAAPLALLTTFTQYKLPFYLGGTVNLGVEKAAEAIRILQPQFVVATHDEHKKAQGLVAALAKISWCANPAQALAPYNLAAKVLEAPLGKPVPLGQALTVPSAR